MFKPGRGGGGRRPPPPPPRAGGSMVRASIPSASRGRGRGGPSTSASARPTREETFSLESGGAPDFASIIKLPPALLDEIRRCEAEGGTARIKFGSNTNNTSENVIEVGLKEYNFTWTDELGVCDIYEVCRNGEDGNGLLMERGSTLGKMNVNRILDETAKKQVKMSSVQAEIQSKSRKSIILDPANPSVQKQVKSMAAAGVEGNMRRWGPKDKFFKKPSQAPIAAPPKTITKVGPPSSSFSKATSSISPAPSPPQHSFRGSGIDLTVETIKEDVTPQNLSKDENKKFEKGAPVRSVNGFKARSTNDSSADLRNLLIKKLSENPNGLTLKALEKAVGSTCSDSGKMENILKTVATYQAPGRYILKPGFAANSSKWHTSDRSSPENTPELHNEIEEALREEENNIINKDDKMHNAGPTSAFYNLEEDPVDIEKIDIEGGSPLVNINIDIDTNNNESEGKASSSSDSSESDSDSDSSDSGSDMSTHSRSRAGSGSQSSSQSESSSSSDDDVEVNITSDDEKEAHPTNGIGADLNMSPSAEHAYGQNGFITEDPGLLNITSSPPINLNDDMHTTPVTAIGAGMDNKESAEENLEQHLGVREGKIKRSTMGNNFMERKFGSGERRPAPSLSTKQNSNLKRTSLDRLPDAKRSKTGPRPNLPVEVIPVGEKKSSRFRDCSPNLPPDRSAADWDVNINLESGYASTSKEQSGVKNTARRSGNNLSISNEGCSDEKSGQKRVWDLANGEANESVPLVKRLKENHTVSQRTGTNDRKSPSAMKKVLRREMSELELGEFREPSPPEDELRRLFGSSSSSKPEDDDDDDEEEDINIEDKSNNANNSVNSNKMVTCDNSSSRSRNVPSASSPNLTMRPQQRAAIYSCSNNHFEAISDIDKDKFVRSLRSDDEDGSNNSNRRGRSRSSKNVVVPPFRPPDPQIESDNNQDSKTNRVGLVKKPSKVLVNGEVSRNKVSSNFDDALYLKYNKDQPDLKGPIHDITQFEEYIKEYQEKYPVYLSLNEKIDEYRERYAKMGKEMDAAKGKNMAQYASVVEKMKEAFHQDKDRHCLLKKIFLILHEELGTIKGKLNVFYEEYTRNID